MSSLVILDLGTGNLRSVSQALAHVCPSADIRISAEPAAILAAERLILPGQGALGGWIHRLHANAELGAAVTTRLRQGPALGICLGLQALYARSEENGGTEGLGLLKGTVKHFSTAVDNASGGGNDNDGNRINQLKIPHMGWNRVRRTRDHPLWHGIDDQQRFYFVHSYFVAGGAPDETVGECEYGGVFTAAAARDNLFATQFHPEKSQRAGLQLLRNFAAWDGAP